MKFHLIATVTTLLVCCLAYAAPFTVNVIPAGVPAPAQAAGFTTQVLNADFTAPAYSNPATFVDNCGSPTGPHFTWTGFLATNRLDCLHDVRVIADPDDPTGSPQVLSVECPPTECTAGSSSGHGANLNWPHVLWSLSEPCNTWSAGCLPIEYYFELVFRLPVARWDQSNGAEAHINHYVTGRNSLPDGTVRPGSGFMETDPFETTGGGSNFVFPPQCPSGFNPCYTAGAVTEPSGTGQSPAPGIWGNGGATDFRQYHKLGVLVTSDGSATVAECVFVDGNLVVPHGDSATGCYTIVNSPDPLIYLQHDNGFTTEFDIFNNMSAVVPLQVLYKSLKIWECPGYQTGTCSSADTGKGPVTHWP